MSLSDQSNAIVSPAYLSAWQEWRDELERERQDPYGFLAYSAIFVLTAEPQRFPGVPGEWTTDSRGPRVVLSADESLTVETETLVGGTARGEHRFAPILEREYRRAASVGDVVIELSKRGGQDLLRPIDPQNALRAKYVRTPAFAPASEWVVEGEFVAFDTPRDRSIETVVQGMVHTYPAVGELVFEREGQEQRLIVFSLDSEGDGAQRVKQGFTFFTDATSGVTTYPASRTLAVALPAEGGPVTIDFNRTRNLECAYTPYSQCSLAPIENRLSVAIEAGEMIPLIG